MKETVRGAPGETSGSSLPQPGDIIAGKYEVEEVIGSGGMGVVVAARHTQLGQRVAIKFLHANAIQDKLAVARILREARACVALQSEHVARVSDVGQLDNGSPYIIMQYQEGTDLETLVARHGPMTISDAVDYTLQASEAIAEAHMRSIVHRDLKPANLFLTHRADGSPLVKVLDFGIAKALQDDAPEARTLTAPGSALGTPNYMSPEQVRDAKAVDRRTDIWGLGAVLQELLTGDPPFLADSLPALCAKIITETPLQLRDTLPDAPEALQAAIDRCLEKQTDARFQTVAELAAALAPFAPKRSEIVIDRIHGIVEGRSSLLELEAYAPSGSLADTVASDPGVTTTPDAAAFDDERDDDRNDDAPDTTDDAVAAQLGETGGAWQTGPTNQQRTTVLAVIGTAVALGALLVWAPWSSPPSETATPGPAASTPTTPPASIAEPPDELDETVATSSASVTPSATASARPVRPKAVDRPARDLHRKSTPSPEPKPQPEKPAEDVDPLGDRK